MFPLRQTLEWPLITVGEIHGCHLARCHVFHSVLFLSKPHIVNAVNPVCLVISKKKKEI